MNRTVRRLPVDRAITDALDAIRRIVRAIRLSARRAERELGVSGAQLFVLQQLAEGPVGSVNELAERTHTHQSSVSVVVRRLVERGLVTRRASRDDARRLELALSGTGRGLLRRSGPAVQVRLIQAMNRLTQVQRSRLAALLRLTVEEMGLAGTPAPMIFAEMQRADPTGGRDRRRNPRGAAAPHRAKRRHR